MRKRIVIGLVAVVAVVAVGGAAYLLSQPKKGSVEWHKREYLRAVKQILHSSVLDRFSVAVETRTGFPLSQNHDIENYAALNRHLKALTESGFLVVTQHSIESEEMWPVIESAVKEARKQIPEERGQYTYIQRHGFLSNGEEKTGVLIISRSEDDLLWAELIRKADAARGGN